MTFTTSAFKVLPGTIYICVAEGCATVQAIFKTMKSAQSFSAKHGLSVRVGHFESETKIVTI